MRHLLWQSSMDLMPPEKLKRKHRGRDGNISDWQIIILKQHNKSTQSPTIVFFLLALLLGVFCIIIDSIFYAEAA